MKDPCVHGLPLAGFGYCRQCATHKPAPPLPGKPHLPHFGRAHLSTAIFLRLLAERKLPAPVAEYQFAKPRKWRADFCWIDQKVILEVNGGIFSQGRHTRGAALLKEWDKINTGAGIGYRFIFCQPSQLATRRTIDYIENAINHKP
jgi:hypothetical protein